MTEFLQVTLNANTIAYAIATVLFSAVAFFLKNVHNKIEQAINNRVIDREDMGKLKGKMEVNKVSIDKDVHAINTKIDGLTESVNTMNEEFKSTHKDIVKLFERLK